MLNPLETTTIGAFPKPNYVPVRDWFDLAHQKGVMDSAETTLQYNLDIQKNKDTHEPLFLRATEEILGVQLRAGVSIPTDGEVRRENYIHYHCRHLAGFDFSQLEHRVLRAVSYTHLTLPTKRIV